MPTAGWLRRVDLPVDAAGRSYIDPPNLDQILDQFLNWRGNVNGGGYTLSNVLLNADVRGAQTPWQTDIDAAGFNLNNVGQDITHTANTEWHFYSAVAQPILFYTAALERLRINANGGITISGQNVAGPNQVTGIRLIRQGDDFNELMDLVWADPTHSPTDAYARLSGNISAPPSAAAAFVFHLRPTGSENGLEHEVFRIRGDRGANGGLAFTGYNTVGVDSITGLFLDRAYDTTGDSMDIVFGGAGANRTARISAAATGGGEAGLIFYAQTGAGDGYSNEVMRILGTGEVSFSKATYGTPVLALRQGQQYAMFGDRGIVQSWPSEGIGGIRFAHNIVHRAGVGDIAVATGGSSFVEVGMDGISLFCNSSMAAGATITVTRRMQITNAGIVQLWLGGSLKTLSVDGSGFVKAA